MGTPASNISTANVSQTICGKQRFRVPSGFSKAGGLEQFRGADAIGAPSGLIAFEAIDGAAVFGASVRSGAESGEAGVDGAVAMGVPSGRILCVVTSVAPFLGLRFALGLCEAPCFPANSRVLNSWFPQQERAREP